MEGGEVPVGPQLIPDAALEPTISVDRAAAILGVHRRTLYTAIDQGKFEPIIRVGRRIRVPTARFLARYELNSDATVEKKNHSGNSVAE